MLGSIGCSKITEAKILGVWQVKSPYYKATYEITHTKDKLVGKVIYYDDGTTILHETGTAKDIFLKNLHYKNGMYIDAVSGATNTTEKTTKLIMKHRDTLQVRSYVHHKPLTEIWTRKQ